MKKKTYIIIICLLSVVCGYGQNTQTADSAYSRPLIHVLKDIEARFDIKIKYDAKMIDGKVLNYADWRIKPWSAEESLYAVLAPFDYTFVMDNGKYKMKHCQSSQTQRTDNSIPICTKHSANIVVSISAKERYSIHASMKCKEKNQAYSCHGHYYLLSNR